jgi:hypothetical protein
MKRGVRGEEEKKRRDWQHRGIDLAYLEEEVEPRNRKKGVIGIRGYGFMGVKECGGGMGVGLLWGVESSM